jgi:hypothetical protein
VLPPTDDHAALVTTRTCRAPHHAISDVGVFEHGQVSQYREVSPVRQDILWLREHSDTRQHILEGIRQPFATGISNKQCAAHRRSSPRHEFGFMDLSEQPEDLASSTRFRLEDGGNNPQLFSHRCRELGARHCAASNSSAASMSSPVSQDSLRNLPPWSV